MADESSAEYTIEYHSNTCKNTHTETVTWQHPRTYTQISGPEMIQATIDKLENENENVCEYK